MAATDTAAANELLAVRAAELYYEENKTQDEIGAILRVTRWKVGRLLQQARDRGIIRIEIVHPRARRLSLERELTARFGLRDAIVVPGPPDDRELQARVAEAAADFLVSVRPIPRLLGVSWGRTLHQVAECLPEGWSTGVNVVQINGGVSLSKRPGTAASTAVMIAQKAGGEATLLPTPAILERLETKRAIEGDRTVSGVVQRARGAAAYLYSAGVADTSSVHVDSGYLTPDDMRSLVEKGAVGDVIGRYITAEGTIADPELDARTLGLGLDELRDAAMSILVIGGEAKHPIAHAIVQHELCSVLVTDEHTARSLLDAAPDSTTSGEDPS
ncbi:MAG: sugar-binding transcriptional regulator [Actinobacteria bacterium]|nr:sugar-binding transcriptional regulator [Actinomycetota bacterium]MBU1609566.1 sugar-binding transcriptional regulator [Actinomycetota bacterium]MBU2315401.1 sugar-binding transcriptional regulator [Actinomycetota bacterium]MBU2385599.1 sugar-binding transcriptional regulator [Actinomycetota bacterium]